MSARPVQCSTGESRQMLAETIISLTRSIMQRETHQGKKNKGPPVEDNRGLESISLSGPVPTLFSEDASVLQSQQEGIPHGTTFTAHCLVHQ